MTRYTKGARSERELLNELHQNGYSVMRSAGSGINTLSPDLIAVKDGMGLAFECKAWDKDTIAIENERFEGLIKWKSNTRMETFVAWRMNGTGWFFIKPEEMKTNGKSKSISRKTVIEINRRLVSIIH